LRIGKVTVAESSPHTLETVKSRLVVVEETMLVPVTTTLTLSESSPLEVVVEKSIKPVVGSAMLK
jgi:hypothetical protein